jgi:hypothetical protein
MAGLLLDSEYETDSADMDSGYAVGAAYTGSLPAPSSTYSGGLGYGGSSAVTGTGSDLYGGGAGYEDAALPSFTPAASTPALVGSTPALVGSTPALVNPTTYSPPTAIDATRGELTTPDAYSYFPTYAPEANFPDANTFLTRGSTDTWNEAVDRYNAGAIASVDKFVQDFLVSQYKKAGHPASLATSYSQYGINGNVDEYGNSLLRDNYFSRSGDAFIQEFRDPDYYLPQIPNPDKVKGDINAYASAVSVYYGSSGGDDVFADFEKATTGQGYETVTDDSQLGQKYYEYEFSEDGGKTWSSTPPAGYNSDGTSISEVGIRAQSSTGERLVPEVIPYDSLDGLGKGNYGTLDVKRLTPEEVEAEGYVHKPPVAIDARRGLSVKSPLGEFIELPDDYSQFADPAFALQANIVLDTIFSTTDGSISSTAELGEAARGAFKTETYDPATDNLFNDKLVNFIGTSLSLLGGGAGAGALVEVVFGLAETTSDYINGDISLGEALLVNGMPLKAVNLLVSLFPPLAIADAVIDFVTGRTIAETGYAIFTGDISSLENYVDQVGSNVSNLVSDVSDFVQGIDFLDPEGLNELVLEDVIGEGFDQLEAAGFQGLDEEGERAQSYISTTKVDVGEGWEQVTDLAQTGKDNYEYEFTTDGGKTWTKVPPEGVNEDGTQQDFNERVEAHQALEVAGGIAGSAGFDIAGFNFSSDFIEQSFGDFSAFADATNGAFGDINFGKVFDGLGGGPVPDTIVIVPPIVPINSSSGGGFVEAGFGSDFGSDFGFDLGFDFDFDFDFDLGFGDDTF